jgi:hypothetical protein
MSNILKNIYKIVIITYMTSSEGHPNPPAEGDEPFFSHDELLRYKERTAGVGLAHTVLTKAKDLDSGINLVSGDTKYTKHFVVDSGGNIDFPFRHYRVFLSPRQGQSEKLGFSELGGITLRYPKMVAASGEDIVDTSSVVITYHLKNGAVDNRFLTPVDSRPFATFDELDISNGYLCGAAIFEYESPEDQDNIGNEDFNLAWFQTVLDAFEPDLQDDQPALAS